MNEYDIYEQLSGLYFDARSEMSGKKVDELFRFLKKFPHVAPFNLALVAVQRPGAGYFLSAGEWRKYGRQIKPEARPLVILRPFGPVEFVFDVSDTIGDELPSEIEKPFAIKSTIEDPKFIKFIGQLRNAGIKYVEVSYGSLLAGSIKRLSNNEKVQVSNKEIKLCFQITVNSSLSNAEKIATIAHELGHLFCGHLGTIDKKSWPNRSDLSEKQNEFEAESVCWLVCERLGINNPSADYLRGYLEAGRTIPSIELGAILRAVTFIESMLHGHFKPLKSLITVEDGDHVPDFQLFT